MTYEGIIEALRNLESEFNIPAEPRRAVEEAALYQQRLPALKDEVAELERQRDQLRAETASVTKALAEARDAHQREVDAMSQKAKEKTAEADAAEARIVSAKEKLTAFQQKFCAKSK